jgi:DNA-binding GntR family transcriptional regulator
MMTPNRRAPAAIARPKPLHEAAIACLRDMIVEGDLAAGERLNEAKLAERLQVSRTPIREAIKLLANEGLVDLLPGRGARVAALPLESVGEMFEVIGGLERHACELAAERMNAQALEALQRKHERMVRHFEAGERRAYFKINHEIHLALVAASGNATLQALHATLIARARRARYAALESPARWSEAMREHEALMRALPARSCRRTTGAPRARSWSGSSRARRWSGHRRISRRCRAGSSPLGEATRDIECHGRPCPGHPRSWANTCA